MKGSGNSGARRSQRLDAICEEIQLVGGVVERIEVRRHTFVYWSLGDRKLIHVSPSSSVSGHAIRSRADIRRQARIVRDAPLLRCCAAI
jgi:hypothetical protein